MERSCHPATMTPIGLLNLGFFCSQQNFLTPSWVLDQELPNGVILKTSGTQTSRKTIRLRVKWFSSLPHTSASAASSSTASSSSSSVSSSVFNFFPSFCTFSQIYARPWNSSNVPPSFIVLFRWSSQQTSSQLCFQVLLICLHQMQTTIGDGSTCPWRGLSCFEWWASTLILVKNASVRNIEIVANA